MQFPCRLYVPLLRLSETSRGNFVMHFIYSQRQILIYDRDTVNISQPAKSLYESTLAATLSSAAESERKREGD